MIRFAGRLLCPRQGNPTYETVHECKPCSIRCWNNIILPIRSETYHIGPPGSNTGPTQDTTV